MRQYIDIVEGLFEAKMLTADNIAVWINPNHREFPNLLAQTPYKELRGLLLSDLYVWDADKAIHDEIEKKLHDTQGIDLYGAMKLNLHLKAVEVSYRDDPDPDGDAEEDEQYVAAHPSIRRAYGMSPEVIASIF